MSHSLTVILWYDPAQTLHTQTGSRMVFLLWGAPIQMQRIFPINDTENVTPLLGRLWLNFCMMPLSLYFHFVPPPKQRGI